MTDEAFAVVSGLMKQGYKLEDIAIYGDSAGAGLAAATTLKVRDQGLGFLAAVALWSPWADLTCVGDSYQTTLHEEPCYQRDILMAGARAYAPEREHQNPYASPVYGDFHQGFPPALIQVGTREILFSDSVRMYQKLEQAGQLVKLDVYEGMWHVFQFSGIDMPEAGWLGTKPVPFFCEHLGLDG